MSPERTAVSQVRSVKSYNLAARPLAVLLAVCCWLSAASGQWLENTIGLSDSFGSICPNAAYYVPSSNSIYIVGDEGVIAIDAVTGKRVARMNLDYPMFMAYDSHDSKVYLGSNLGDDSLSVIDPAAHRVVSRLQVGRYMAQVCYNPTANKVYCLAGRWTDSVTVVDCSSDSVVARIWVGSNERDYTAMCCSPAGNKVYVASLDEEAIAVIDGAGDSLLGMLPVDGYPLGMAYCPAGNKLYCSLYGSDAVAVIDAGPDTLLAEIEVGVDPVRIAYNPLANKLYCGNEGDHSVSVIDCQADTVLATIDLGPHGPTTMLFDSADNRVFCFFYYYDSFPAISGSGDTIEGWVRFQGRGDGPDQACYSPQTNRLYIVGNLNNDVAVVDPVTCSVVGGLQMYPEPTRECYAEPLDRLYVSDDESGIVAVVRCSTNVLERRIFTPATSLRLPVYSPASGKLYYDAELGDDRVVLVVDCAHDSLEKMLPMNEGGAAVVVYNPAVDRVYRAHGTSVSVLDCGSDSIVAAVPFGRSVIGLTCNADSNRVYCASTSADSLYISALDCSADTVLGSVFAYAGYSPGLLSMCYIPSRDLVCSTTGGTSMVVVDGPAKQLVQTVELGRYPWGLCPDRASSKLYCLLPNDNELAAIDCRDMSIEAKVLLAAEPCRIGFDSIAERVYTTHSYFGCVSFVDGRTNRFLGLLEAGQRPGEMTWVPRHRRMYVVDARGQAIVVLKDTSLAGLCGSPATGPFRNMATVVRGVLFLPRDGLGTRSGLPDNPVMSRAALLDISGRKVLDLLPGANDVRALAPGVYFV